MDEFPVVKGWIPFKSVGSAIVNEEQKLKKQKQKESFKNKGADCEGLSVPKDWKTPSFKLEDNPHQRLFAESVFKVLFPKKLTPYLKEAFPIAQKAIEEHCIKAQMILNNYEMSVSTTRKTYDPVMIIKAHSVIKLLSRYVPVEEAITVLNDDLHEDIINIGHRKKETFVNRRKRLAEPSIVALIKEILECKVFISGKTVCAIGSYSNLDKVRDIVMDCFDKNIHPIYQLKRLQLINKFKTMPEMEGKDWSTYLPPIPKKNVKRKKPMKVKEKKEYSLFPPAPVESKVDKDLAAGVYHLKYEKKGKSYFTLIDKQKTKDEEKQKKRLEMKKERLEAENSKTEEVDKSKKTKIKAEAKVEVDESKKKKVKTEAKVGVDESNKKRKRNDSEENNEKAPKKKRKIL